MEQTDTIDKAIGILMGTVGVLVALFTAWMVRHADAGLEKAGTDRYWSAKEEDVHVLFLADGTWNLILWSAMVLIVTTVAVALAFHGEREISRIVAKNRAAVTRILSESGRRMGMAVPGRGA